MATIAISGKGGSGKTTLAAMIVRHIVMRAAGPVLAVDADPNSCLGLMLGVEPTGTIAQLREQAAAKGRAASGVDRLRSFEYGLQQVITEAKGFDLLTMGRPEGPGCYCSANNILRTFLDKTSSQYKYVVIDNEAGMEHLSRRTNGNVDVLCIVAEQTAVGETTARRILELARELPIAIKRIGVVWNKAEQDRRLEGIDTFGAVPFDEALLDASVKGKTIFDIGEHSPALSAVGTMLDDKLNLWRILNANSADR
jgi:CO dehydrogenase maturation factor